MLAVLLVTSVFATTAIARPTVGSNATDAGVAGNPVLASATYLGPAAANQPMTITVSLALQNRAGLDAFLAALQDPTSASYHRFLTPAQFTAAYGPTTSQVQGTVAFLEAQGFTVTSVSSDRMLVTAVGTVGAAESAFHVQMNAYRYHGHDGIATPDQPTLPANLRPFTVGVLGLSTLVQAQPRLSGVQPILAPKSSLGSNCCSFSPNDLHTLYDEPAATTDGSGVAIAIAGAYDFKDSDLQSFDSQWGLQNPATAHVCTGSGHAQACKFNRQNSIEASLDAEYAHGTAPGASLGNYMAASTSLSSFTTMYSYIVTNDVAPVVTTSWGACEGAMSTSTIHTDDNIFAEGNALGQSWFAASGDSGSNDCSGSLGVDFPAASPYVFGVGGTHAACSPAMTSSHPACGGYGSESAWSGSGGGQSTVHAKPAWQTGCGVPNDGARDVPDIAMEADTSPGNYVLSGGSWYIVGGTSDAAPQVGGAFAMVDQNAGGGQGLPTALYGLCGTTVFHDITSGSNGAYSAGAGYDRVTGLGTLDVAALIAAYPTSTGGGGGTTNSPPTASFTSSCSNLVCSFDGSGSTDSDGSIVAYAWDFGDGGTATGATASHTYAAAGTYTVTLTVTDNGSATGSTQHSVTVSSPSSGGSTMHVQSIAMVLKGPNVHVTITIVDGSGNALSGVAVAADTCRSGGTCDAWQGTTGSSGTVTLNWVHAGSGTYQTCVTSLQLAGYTWDAASDPNQCVTETV